MIPLEGDYPGRRQRWAHCDHVRNTKEIPMVNRVIVIIHFVEMGNATKVPKLLNILLRDADYANDHRCERCSSFVSRYGKIGQFKSFTADLLLFI